MWLVPPPPKFSIETMSFQTTKKMLISSQRQQKNKNALINLKKKIIKIKNDWVVVFLKFSFFSFFFFYKKNEVLVFFLKFLYFILLMIFL
jgi:hypothetical protein